MARLQHPGDIVRMIDHTLLKADATAAQIELLCAQAREYHFATVCVNPCYVSLCSRLLLGSDTAVCTVIGFPLGATLTAAKVCEAELAIDQGAAELDMVINVGALKSGNTTLVEKGVAAVAKTCHSRNATLKVIIEAALLTDEEKVLACRLAQQAGADYVKTSTGFGPGGATVADVALMRQTVGPAMGVKAAGGIRSFADAWAMVEAGATRIGASASVQIAEEAAAAGAGD